LRSPRNDEWNFAAEQAAIASAPDHADEIRNTFRHERERERQHEHAVLRDREIRADAHARYDRAVQVATTRAQFDRAEMEHALALAANEAERDRIHARYRNIIDCDSIPGLWELNLSFSQFHFNFLLLCQTGPDL
jgi:hypothetical protein